MRILRFRQVKSIALMLSAGGLIGFAGGCDEGGPPSKPTTPADSKAMEDAQRAARTKAFGVNGAGNPTKEMGKPKPVEKTP
jgi:hypothetical protein